MSFSVCPLRDLFSSISMRNVLRNLRGRKDLNMRVFWFIWKFRDFWRTNSFLLFFDFGVRHAVLPTYLHGHSLLPFSFFLVSPSPFLDRKENKRVPSAAGGKESRVFRVLASVCPPCLSLRLFVHSRRKVLCHESLFFPNYLKITSFLG